MVLSVTNNSAKIGKRCVATAIKSWMISLNTYAHLKYGCHGRGGGGGVGDMSPSLKTVVCHLLTVLLPPPQRLQNLKLVKQTDLARA